MADTRGRQVVLALTNRSGGSVAAGDVVVFDTTGDESFTTTTTGRAELSVGVAQETIANLAAGRVLVSGYAALVNVPSSRTRGEYLETHTVVKQATGSATRRSGSFGQYAKTSATPSAWLWGQTDQSASAAGNPTYIGCRISDTAAQSIANNTLVALAFAAADTYDANGFHDPVTNNTRITPNVAGKYMIGGTVTLGSSSTVGARLIGVRLNGTTYVGLDERPGIGTTEQYISIATEYIFNGTTDYAELIYRQTTGGAVTLSANAQYGAQFWCSLSGV